MRVLIIGATRFVGRQLLWRLLAGDHRATPDFARLLSERAFDVTIDFAAEQHQTGGRAQYEL